MPVLAVGLMIPLVNKASPRDRRDAEHKVGVLARYSSEIARFREAKQEAAVDARRKRPTRRPHAKAHSTRPDAPNWVQLTRWRRWQRSSSDGSADRAREG